MFSYSCWVKFYLVEYGMRTELIDMRSVLADGGWDWGIYPYCIRWSLKLFREAIRKTEILSIAVQLSIFWHFGWNGVDSLLAVQKVSSKGDAPATSPFQYRKLLLPASVTAHRWYSLPLAMCFPFPKRRLRLLRKQLWSCLSYWEIIYILVNLSTEQWIFDSYTALVVIKN